MRTERVFNDVKEADEAVCVAVADAVIVMVGVALRLGSERQFWTRFPSAALNLLEVHDSQFTEMY